MFRQVSLCHEEKFEKREFYNLNKILNLKNGQIALWFFKRKCIQFRQISLYHEEKFQKHEFHNLRCYHTLQVKFDMLV